MRRIFLLTVFALSSLGGAESAAPGAGGMLLDESGYWRKYYRFGVDLVSPAALRAEGTTVLDRPQWERLRTSTEKSLVQSETDFFAVFHPSTVILRRARTVGTERAFAEAQNPTPRPDWTEHVFVRTFYDPYTAPPPPEDWCAPAFDDGTWVLGRNLFQPEMADDLPQELTAGNMSRVHLDALQYVVGGVQSCYYRARFVVDDPAKFGPATLRLVYRGGVRAFLNGKELVRGHLPQGEITPDTPGADYPLAAYEDPALRDRAIGPVAIPPHLLIPGTDVLAVKVRASPLHPTVLTRPRSNSWNALHERQGMWRHVHLSKVELRAALPPAAPSRPASVFRRASSPTWTMMDMWTCSNRTKPRACSGAERRRVSRRRRHRSFQPEKGLLVVRSAISTPMACWISS